MHRISCRFDPPSQTLRACLEEPAVAPRQEKSPPLESTSNVGGNKKKAPVASDERVSELDNAIWHGFQAKNGRRH